LPESSHGGTPEALAGPGRCRTRPRSACATGADIVLYYGFTLLAAYDGVKTALEAFRDVQAADKVPGVRENVEEFERFIGYPEFTERARRYGLA